MTLEARIADHANRRRPGVRPMVNELISRRGRGRDARSWCRPCLSSAPVTDFRENTRSRKRPGKVVLLWGFHGYVDDG